MDAYYSDDDVTLHLGDSLDILPTLADASVDAIVTDPPYALPGGFMGKAWDQFDGQEDAAFAYWLAGLIDGEGHFAIKAHTRGTHAPAFTLKMRADELGTLKGIQRTLGIGTINQEDRQPNPMAKWIVQDKAGCQRLVDLLDKYPLRAKKRMDYDIWRQAVCEWSGRPRGNRWAGPADNTRMAGLRKRLMDGRRYADPPWSGHEFQDWCRLWARECWRVLKPGGHLLAFGGTRTYHRMTVAIEDAGFDIRDSLHWIYGSGFPKSLDVSKAIDKAAGAEREVVATVPDRWAGKGDVLQRATQDVRSEAHITAPATAEAISWEGWGTALKPAHEPIVLARKPLTGTVAATVLEHGTGALNIDATRTVAGQDYRDKCASVVGLDSNRNGDADGEWTGTREDSAHVAGRWPTNVLLSHPPLIDGHGQPVGDACADGCVNGCPVAEMDAQSGIGRTNKPGSRSAGGQHGAYSPIGAQPGSEMPYYGDEGGASRFFPVFRYEAKAPASERPRLADGTAHTTVKPLNLMRWLVRLVTPPGGTVLEPFAGSGTTLEACVIEGFHGIGIELGPDHAALCRARLSKPLATVLFGDLDTG